MKKYIRTTCRVKQLHLDEGSSECFLKILRKSLQSDLPEGVSQLVREINSELEDVPSELADKVVDLYKRQQAKQEERLKKFGR